MLASIVQVMEELKQYFRPEFLNRLDEIIVFRQLTKIEVKSIADIMLKGVIDRAKEKQITIDLTERCVPAAVFATGAIVVGLHADSSSQLAVTVSMHVGPDAWLIVRDMFALRVPIPAHSNPTCLLACAKDRVRVLCFMCRFKDRLVDEGFNPSYGARPLRRAIQRLLEDALAERMLGGDIKEGDSVIMDVDSEGNVTVLNGDKTLTTTVGAANAGIS